MQSRLNGRSQSAAIVHGERDKAKWLLRASQRAKHFRRAEHWPGMGEKHHLHLQALINWHWQGKQSTVHGKHLKFTGSALTILKSKHRGSEVCEVNSRCAQLSVQLGEAVHVHASIVRTGDEREITKVVVRIPSTEFGTADCFRNLRRTWVA